jgi:hypothetical protein
MKPENCHGSAAEGTTPPVEREFARLGSTHTRRVDVHLAALTNQTLDLTMAERKF